MSAYSVFLRCHAITAAWEGGWSNHAADPGGKTMYGITEKVWIAWNKAKGILKPKPVRQITRAEAEEIYYHEYWLAAGCQNLRPGVDLCTYDSSVNSGVSRGRKWLLASVGGTDVQTVKKMCAKRLSFLRGLTTFAVFGKGWVNRVTDVEAKGVAMALAAEGASKTEVSSVLASDAEQASANSVKATSRAKKTVGTTTVGGAGTTAAPSVLQPEHADLIANWLLGGVLAAGVVVLAYFIFRSMVEKSRANSYEGQAA